MNGVISMDPATSHFSLCGTNIPALDGHHIVFGQVYSHYTSLQIFGFIEQIVDGYGILRAVLQCGALTGKPKTEVSIIDCGRLDSKHSFPPSYMGCLSKRIYWVRFVGAVVAKEAA